jgi:hypothetical protein
MSGIQWTSYLILQKLSDVYTINPFLNSFTFKSAFLISFRMENGEAKNISSTSFVCVYFTKSNLII